MLVVLECGPAMETLDVMVPRRRMAMVPGPARAETGRGMALFTAGIAGTSCPSTISRRMSFANAAWPANTPSFPGRGGMWPAPRPPRSVRETMRPGAQAAGRR